jgi:hypothetical protein
LALKLVNTAMSKGTNGFNALKLMLETFDGKAKQEIDASVKGDIGLGGDPFREIQKNLDMEPDE